MTPAHSNARPSAGDRVPHEVHPDRSDLPGARLAKLERLANNLDSRYRVPGTSIRFGWDSILGLLPGVGDVAALGPAAYIWLEAHRLGVPGRVKARMALNTGLDWAVGSVPLVGDLLDVGIKANRRNVALLRAHLERTGAVPAGGDKPADLFDPSA
ncbi:DUF4112 domain-containing protein [Jannaschia sp. W003]|uniref:DUF4112 domain-containing protein n=1 Tax=Jannaschia sp. W003 TaxID=2867012 RepID=UPI0021A6BFB3|nr:DUF4112 domain-containing protein [Jannaschia sp. W003]UWQ21135.1 DUF4112 domain-containing protein [Jannaschia sp. W003]